MSCFGGAQEHIENDLTFTVLSRQLTILRCVVDHPTKRISSMRHLYEVNLLYWIYNQNNQTSVCTHPFGLCRHVGSLTSSLEITDVGRGVGELTKRRHRGFDGSRGT